ncbi:MAG: zf-HC2 domain-containing protein [Ardenticatenaceae bacterium]|nr:zf-HC2 domain-containing protein [Ardenticatenaceae bacterium]
MNDATRQTCQQLLGDLSAYVDGEAQTAVCAAIEQHLAGCENCRVVVDTLHKTIFLYQQLPQPDLPAGARDRLIARLEIEPI